MRTKTTVDTLEVVISRIGKKENAPWKSLN